MSLHPGKGEAFVYEDSGGVLLHPGKGEAFVYEDSGGVLLHPGKGEAFVYKNSGDVSLHPGTNASPLQLRLGLQLRALSVIRIIPCT